MNTIEFLLSLTKTHELRAGVNDLDGVIDNFSEKMFEYNYGHIYPNAEDFLTQLKIDFQNISSNQLEELLPYIHKRQYLCDQKYTLLNLLRKELLIYSVKHIEEFNFIPYVSSLAFAIVMDLQDKLAWPIRASLSKEDAVKKVCSIPVGVTCANISNDVESQKHTLNFYEKAFQIGKKKDNILFELYTTLYHEGYHCLVCEKSNSLDCYDPQILQFARYHTIRDILDDEYLASQKDPMKFSDYKGRKFYQKYYDINKEESRANEYGFHHAISSLKEISPNFDFKKATSGGTTLLNYEEGLATLTMSNNPFHKKTEEDEIEEMLDERLMNHPEYVQGILTKIYEPNGKKKEFSELFADYQESLENHQDQKDDIQTFYEYAVERLLKGKSIEEIKSWITSKETALFFQSLFVNRLQKMEEEMKDLKGYITSVTGIYKKKLSIRLMKEQLQKLLILRESLSPIIDSYLSEQNEYKK